MRTDRIRSMIAEAIHHENETGYAASLIRQFAARKGQHIRAAQVKEIVKFMCDYASCVPEILENLASAAGKAGMTAELSAPISVIEDYFFNPYDVIPDQIGLAGLMDDAYLAMQIIQNFSNTYKEQTGRLLLEHDFTNANILVRNLIGEPYASQLDLYINATAWASIYQQLFLQGINWGTLGQIYNPELREIEDTVNIKLGAMGVL